MNYPFVGKAQAKIGCLNGIDVADQIGNTYIRRGQFFAVPLAAVQPFDGGSIAFFMNQVFGIL